jgi:DNA-binding response OmpR family regulator
MTSRPILIVEDDASLRQVLVDHLQSAGNLEPVEAATLAEAAEHLASPDARFDAVLLDITLPDGDGCTFCAFMRQQGHTMPVIMLTGASAEEDVVRGLEAGANDYIIKPFRAGELIARLQVQFRAFEHSESAIFTIGPYTFRPAAKLLTIPQKNKRIYLTDKEVRLLKHLYRAEGKSISRKTLLHEIWGYNADVDTHALETHVYRLRQKIEPDPAHCRILLTVNGGYKLNPNPAS